MFERFTERARQVIVLAQEEARRLAHNYIGTEHLFVGLVREEEGVAARVLASFDVTVEKAQAVLEKQSAAGGAIPTGQIPFTPRARKALEMSLREALSLGHNYIGTEHLLLALGRDLGLATQALYTDLELDPEKLRAEVIRLLSGSRARGRAPNGEQKFIVTPTRGLAQADGKIEAWTGTAKTFEDAAIRSYRVFAAPQEVVFVTDSQGVTKQMMVVLGAREVNA